MQRRPSIRSVTLAALALAATPLFAASAASSPPPRGTGPERGVAVVQCREPASGRTLRTRAAILDLGVQGSRRDVLLTTAHGLPADSSAVLRDCSIYADGDRPYRLHAARVDSNSDWALLTTKRRLRGEITRLKPLELPPATIADTVNDRSPLRLLRLLEHAECRADVGWLSASELEAGLFMHSCHSWPGLSGSPLTVRSSGELRVIGVHLGRVWRPLHASGPPVRSLGRSIDGSIATALSELRTLVAETK